MKLRPELGSRFFHFLQCQLRMEARHCMQEELELQDQQAERLQVPLQAPMIRRMPSQARAIWPHFEEWVQPNLGKKDRDSATT